MIRFLLGVLALVFSVGVGAQSTCYQYNTSGPVLGYPSGYYATKQIACEERRAYVEWASPGYTTQKWTNAGSWEAGTACNVNLYYASGAQQGQQYISYSYSYGSQATTCGPSCQSGQTQWFNITYGWDRSPGAASASPTLKADGSPNVPDTAMPPASMCVQGCLRTVDMTSGSNVGDFWVSTEPTAQGLYRRSVDLLYTSTATACTESASESKMANPGATPPSCDGFVGYIGSKLTCVPRTPESPSSLPRTSNVKAGNPAAASAGGKTETGNVNGIPPTGTGTNSGGPPTTSDGGVFAPNGVFIGATPSTPGSGTKTATAGEEQVACGAPGQPPCKIDETGTATGPGGDMGQKALADADASRNTGLTGILNKGDKDTSWVMPTWFHEQSTCTGWNLGALPIGSESFTINLDLCAIKPYIVGVANFLWVFGTFLAVLAMMSRVMFESKG